MTRTHDTELEGIKQAVDLIRLIEESGVSLRRVGSEHRGLCCWHADKRHPSLSASSTRRLWRCFTCGAAGDCFTWVMKRDGVGFAAAKAILRAWLGAQPTRPRPAVRARRPAVPAGYPDADLLRQAVDAYARALERSPAAHRYLASRGLDDARLVETFQLGVGGPVLELSCDRERLMRAGLLRRTGHHHFAGRLTMPVLTEQGEVANICGRRLLPGGVLDRYRVLPGPRAGIWNGQALARHEEVVLAEGIIDGLTLYRHGFDNVIACLGVEDFCMGHVEAIERHGVRRVLVAFDRDDAGERGAARVAQMLAPFGVACSRVELPHGMDVNTYARKVEPARKALELVIAKARPIEPPRVRPAAAVSVLAAGAAGGR